VRDLKDRVQQVADLAGKPGREEEFTTRYAELLAELQAALLAARRNR
jgi:hypothetical protein